MDFNQQKENLQVLEAKEKNLNSVLKKIQLYKIIALVVGVLALLAMIAIPGSSENSLSFVELLVLVGSIVGWVINWRKSSKTSVELSSVVSEISRNKVEIAKIENSRSE